MKSTRAFWVWHCEHEADGSILLIAATDPKHYGRVRVDAESRVRSFEEKAASREPGWINAGIYILGHRLLRSIPAHNPVSLEQRDVSSLDQAKALWVPQHSAFSRYRHARNICPRGAVLTTRTTMTPQQFVLLDRDGTIIEERHYLSAPEQVELISGVADGLRRLSLMGLGLVVITNQSGVGRGFFDAVAAGADPSTAP